MIESIGQFLAKYYSKKFIGCSRGGKYTVDPDIPWVSQFGVSTWHI